MHRTKTQLLLLLALALSGAGSALAACSRSAPLPGVAQTAAPTSETTAAPVDGQRIAPSAALTAAVSDVAASTAGADGGLDAAAAVSRPMTYKVALLAGDSMVGVRCCLSKALGERFRAEGARLVSDAWSNVTTAAYDADSRFSTLVRQTRPDLVLISLGTNDVFVPHPEALARNVESIVRKAGVAPGVRDCYWIGPPTWTKDTGIVDVIRKHAAPCRFFDSSGLTLERIRDGVHVTNDGGAAWAAHFWEAFRGPTRANASTAR